MIKTIYRLVTFWVIAAVFRSVSGYYLGSHVTFGQAYKLVWSRFRTVLIASVLFTIFCILPSTYAWALTRMWSKPNVILGMVVLGGLLASILFRLWFAVTPQCIMATNHSAWQSMKQSRKLVAGHLKRVFALGFLLIAIYLGVQLITGWREDLFLQTLLQDTNANPTTLGQLRYAAVNILLLPFTAVAYSLLYYDLCARRRYPELGKMQSDLK